MTIVEIICIALLGVLIVLLIVDFYLEYLLSKRDCERDRKIDSILDFVEKEMDDNVFPDFKE